MKKNILLTILALAFVIEMIIAILCFFKPIAAAELLGIQYSEQTAFLGYIIAWFCLLVSILIGYTFILLKNNQSGYSPLIYILGLWWIGLGIGVFIAFGKIDNLLIDSIKGLALVVVNYLRNKELVNSNDK
jgi:hypothetical protein